MSCFFWKISGIMLIFLVVLSCTPASRKDHKLIGIIQIVSDIILDDATRGVVYALGEAGFIDGENISIEKITSKTLILNQDIARELGMTFSQEILSRGVLISEENR